MKSARVLFATALVLVLAGVGLILLEPGPPDGECAEDEMITSGFVDEDSGCALSIESADAIMEYEQGPFWFRIAGLVVILVGVAFLIAGIVVAVRGRRAGGPAPPGTP